MIEKELAGKILREALKTGADLAEIYVEDVTSTQLGFDDSKLEQAVHGADRGAGIRVFFGNLVTYAYTDSLSENSLLDAAHAAASAGASSAKTQLIDLTERKSPLVYPVEKELDSMRIEDKAAILHRIDETARAYSPLIVQVFGSYGERVRRVWIYNSTGLMAHDERTFVEIRMGVVAKKNGTMQRSFRGFGGQKGLELLDDNDPTAVITEVAESAIKMLDAIPCPAGEMTVVMPNGWGGVLFHEACGHQMEADFITKGTSAYAGKVGEVVASPIITAIDDGTIPGRRGSLRFDDDGTPAQRTVLIERGVLKEYMWDLVEARRVGREASTGNGRRESYRHMPMPRMTNTFIDNGEHDPQEIIESTKRGIYIKQMAGGQAELAKGDFVFNATEAYLIEEGKLTAPVRGATVFGNGPAVLKEIDMLGNDLALDPGMGICGKGQSARVSVGQPTLRIPKVQVGGTDEPVEGVMG
ncbi:MAG: TldD/PmbA family protein [Chloroflexi bacterium]|nr:MAG: TldD/PmbA family protein [Chloroflexota bacterium]